MGWLENRDGIDITLFKFSLSKVLVIECPVGQFPQPTAVNSSIRAVLEEGTVLTRSCEWEKKVKRINTESISFFMCIDFD